MQLESEIEDFYLRSGAFIDNEAADVVFRERCEIEPWYGAGEVIFKLRPTEQVNDLRRCGYVSFVALADLLIANYGLPIDATEPKVVDIVGLK